MLMYVGQRVTGQSTRWIEYKDGPRGLASVSQIATTPNDARQLRG
jgi:hypothetical protein